MSRRGTASEGSTAIVAVKVGPVRPRRVNLRVNPWIRFAVRRSARLVVSLWVLVTFAAFIIHLVPGDPVRKALGINASADVVASTRHDLGLDQSVPAQYWDYLGHLIHGDLGRSLSSGLPVDETISELLPNTILLALIAFGVTILVAVPLGLIMAVLTQNGRRRPLELAYTTVSIVLGSIPEFLLGVALVYLLGVRTHLLPVAGQQGVASYVMPVLALSLGAIVGISRIVRVEILSVLERDYMRTARLKRLPGWKLYVRHALPNALTATATIAGLLLGGLIAGTVLVETIFAWPGLGQVFVTAITSYDFTMVQALVLVYGGLVLVINFLVDLLLAVVDPQTTIRES
ncbi:peptide/nickel transport system permease protein [Nakamurella sp. UYEF19]|uniref:ABC transporter permease n=1 Tax=Nakamurella sp. UYEF19 TaxID=1756392 RepID=UPI0033931CBC